MGLLLTGQTLRGLENSTQVRIQESVINYSIIGEKII